MLTALERSELLERDDDGSYVAGSLFWLYAARHDPCEDLVRLARPTLAAIGEETHETVNLSVARGDRVVQVAQVDSPLHPRLPRLDPDRRARPLLVPGQGVPRLGRRDAARRPARAPPRTPSPTVPALRAELARSRRRGWATTVDELEVGLSGIAVPVLGPRGQVVGAARRLGPDPHDVQVRFDEVGPLLSDHAAELTELLRGKTPEEAA